MTAPTPPTETPTAPLSDEEYAAYDDGSWTLEDAVEQAVFDPAPRRRLHAEVERLRAVERAVLDLHACDDQDAFWPLLRAVFDAAGTTSVR